MPRRPISLRVARAIALLLAGRCVLRVGVCVATERSELSYGTMTAPYWLDVLIIGAVVLCLLRSGEPTRPGLVAACLPVLAWLLLTAFGPESWRLWHWISAGFPEGLRGLELVAFEPPVDRLYRSQMELRGAVLGTFLEQFIFAGVLGSLTFGRASRAYFRSGVLRT